MINPIEIMANLEMFYYLVGAMVLLGITRVIYKIIRG